MPTVGSGGNPQRDAAERPRPVGRITKRHIVRAGFPGEDAACHARVRPRRICAPVVCCAARACRRSGAIRTSAGAVGTNFHDRGEDLLQRRQQPVRGKCEERQLSQPRADSVLTAAEHEREADEAHRRHAFHEVPGILRDDLTMRGGEREGRAGALEPVAKEVLHLQDDDLLDGAEALVHDLGLFDGKVRLGLSEAQHPVAHDEVDQGIPAGQPGDHRERDHRLQQQRSTG